MRVAVAGGTGVVGRLVVEELRRQRFEAVVLSRSTGQDLTTGAGLDDALDGVHAVIDCSNVVATAAKKSVAFFEAATRNLLEAEERADVGHHVVLSIVGADRVSFGYYAGKVRQEQLAMAGPIPTTVLRATQFHEFPGQLLERMKGPVAVIPKMQSQTVAAAEVAAHLVDLALGRPLGMTDEMAGPEVHQMPDLARQVVAARGESRRVVPLRLPGRAGGQMARGDLLPTGHVVTGRQTFAEWLTGQQGV
ncbi:SDR family oxidoreductase [Nocardioides montaniterrae]